MPVEDVFSITGRGTVATGRIEAGVVKVGDEVLIMGLGANLKSTVTGVGNVPQTLSIRVKLVTTLVSSSAVSTRRTSSAVW